ncbi:hypothetical protein C2S51_029505 [Perilla frutescens var. frutescens]|nr:hypothetical protein C2S51_029505 [Perilla frutescens var. frutescens]
MSSNSSALQTLSPEPHSPFSWTQTDDQKAGHRDSSTSGLNSTDYWNFSQHLANTTLLNARSLEMCTEILGCETGTYIDPTTDKCLQTPRERQCSATIRPRKTRDICKKIKHVSSFPPPLTSISSGYGIKVQAHRGGGRLVITAFTSNSGNSGRIHFKSERENGRLRLFLHKDYGRKSEQELVENIKENGGKVGCSFKCGDGSGSNKLTSLPICVAFS